MTSSTPIVPDLQGADSSSADDRRGYVYVLSNRAMPGIVKIGRSKHGGQGRADALYRNDTGVPEPFRLEFEILTEDAPAVEHGTHVVLQRKRVNPAREFFRISVREATACVMGFAGHLIDVQAGMWPDVIDVSAFRYEVLEELARSGHTLNGLPLIAPDYAAVIEHFAMSPSAIETYLPVYEMALAERRARLDSELAGPGAVS